MNYTTCLLFVLVGLVAAELGQKGYSAKYNLKTYGNPRGPIGGEYLGGINGFPGYEYGHGLRRPIFLGSGYGGYNTLGGYEGYGLYNGYGGNLGGYGLLGQYDGINGYNGYGLVGYGGMRRLDAVYGNSGLGGYGGMRGLDAVYGNSGLGGYGGYGQSLGYGGLYGLNRFGTVDGLDGKIGVFSKYGGLGKKDY